MKQTAFFGMFLLCAAWCAAAPLRVVSLAPAITETIYSLGAEKCLVGRSSACDTPVEAKNLPVCGDFAIADVEKILLCHPDCVLTHTLVNASARNALTRAGIKVYALPCDSVGDYRAMVRKLGELLDCRPAAEREIARVDENSLLWKSLPRNNRKMLVVVWDQPLVVAGEGTFCYDLLDLAGEKGVDFKGEKGFFMPDSEYLLQNDPDVILAFFPAAELSRHAVLRKLRAVRENRVISLAGMDIFQRPSPRWCDAVTSLRKLFKELK